jgi:hypothetical protein
MQIEAQNACRESCCVTHLNKTVSVLTRNIYEQHGKIYSVNTSTAQSSTHRVTVESQQKLALWT